MLLKELNRIQCKTYLVACEKTRRAMLVDPERDYVNRYLAILAYNDLTLQASVDTHTHADHLSGATLLAELTSAELIMHELAPTPRVTRHVKDGDVIELGSLRFGVLYTPGHTPDSISLYGDGKVFTGDVLLIGGTGRADFAGGDAGDQYDAITKKLFVLPDETLVYPAHDYRGKTVSSIGAEKAHNPRIAGRTRQEYIDLMASIEFPLPSKIQEVLQPNQTAIDDMKMTFPTLAQLNEVLQLSTGQVVDAMNQVPAPLVLDVREPEEFHGELGHITGSALMPLKEVPIRAESELGDHLKRDVIVVCRSGVRSTTAAAILTGLGFRKVSNLRGGMVEWNARGLPVAR